MATRDDHSAPTWSNQLWHARRLSTVELRRHAAVSRDNGHRCRDCFCCAAWTVLEARARGEEGEPIHPGDRSLGGQPTGQEGPSRG